MMSQERRNHWFGGEGDVGEPTRVCAVRWQVPAPAGADREYIEHTATARSVEEVFACIERAEQQVFARYGLVSAVCLDDPSGECLYVGAAGDRWSLYYLRMPEVGDGELFARPVGDPAAVGITEVIEEMGEDVSNSHFVPRAVAEEAVREWWRSKSLWDGVEWHYESSSGTDPP
jgi:Immunity protein Imm1